MASFVTTVTVNYGCKFMVLSLILVNGNTGCDITILFLKYASRNIVFDFKLVQYLIKFVVKYNNVVPVHLHKYIYLQVELL